jgi:arylsulfatase A-like enzyme
LRAIRVQRLVDGWVGRLLDGLDARGGERLTLLTADHGECFERGIYFEHADCLWEGGVRIPMIVQYPDGEHSAERIAGLSGIVDVAPTVFDVLGEAPSASWSGQSLLNIDELQQRSMLIQHPFYQPSAAEQRPARRASIPSVAGEATLPILIDREQVGLVRGDWKYIRTGGQGLLYRRSSEERDLPVEEASIEQELSDELDRSLGAHALRLLDTPAINADMLEMLCALGYVACPDTNKTGEPSPTPPPSN